MRSTNTVSQGVIGLIVASTVLLAPLLSHAVTGQGGGGSFDPMKIPVMTEAVVDYASVIDATAIQSLRAQAAAYQSQTTNELATVLFPSREGNQLADIGLKVFREAGIGDKKKNNGLLLLIATEEKKIRIVVGYGLEGAFPDVSASEVIEKYIRPLVNSGDFVGAVKAYYDIVPKYIAGEYTAATATTTTPGQSLSLFDMLGAIVVAMFFVITASRIKESKRTTHTVYQDTPRGKMAVTQGGPSQRYMKYFFPGFLGGMFLSALQPWGMIMTPRGLIIGAFLGLMTLGGMDNRRGGGGFFPGSGGWSSGGGGWGGGGGFDFGGGSSGGGGAGD